MQEYNVYLLESDGKYKIGFTRNDPEKRIKQMKTGNFNGFNLIGQFKSKWGTKIESKLHKKHKQKKISGEWFNLTNEDVLTFELECQMWHNIFEDIEKNSTWVIPRKY